MSIHRAPNVDKEPARLPIRLIVVNQRLESPITLSRDYYHWIGWGNILVKDGEMEERKRQGK